MHAFCRTMHIMKRFLLAPILASFVVACAPRGMTNSGLGVSVPAPGGLSGETPPAEGTINGGGGVGLRCGDALEMLDLYEARQAGIAVVAVPASEADAVALVSSRIARHFWNVETIPAEDHQRLIAREIVEPIFEGRAFLNAETKKTEAVEFVNTLPFSEDYGAYRLPPGCSLEQVAFFSDARTRLSIVKSSWARLDWLSKSVLVAHEVLYMVDRRDGLRKLKAGAPAETSEETRRFVGRLFSARPLTAKSDRMPPRSSLRHCIPVSMDGKAATYFYAFDDPASGHLSLVFNSVRGFMDLYQTRVDFKQAVLGDLDAPEGTIAETSALDLVGSGRASGFAVRLTKAKAAKPGGSLTFELLDVDPAGRTEAIGSPQLIQCQNL